VHAKSLPEVVAICGANYIVLCRIAAPPRARPTVSDTYFSKERLSVDAASRDGTASCIASCLAGCVLQQAGVAIDILPCWCCRKPRCGKMQQLRKGHLATSISTAHCPKLNTIQYLQSLFCRQGCEHPTIKWLDLPWLHLFPNTRLYNSCLRTLQNVREPSRFFDSPNAVGHHNKAARYMFGLWHKVQSTVWPEPTHHTESRLPSGRLSQGIPHGQGHWL
jgi:hypothetical protein